VLFLVDLTGSFAEELPVFQEDVDDIMSEIKELNTNARVSTNEQSTFS